MDHPDGQPLRGQWLVTNLLARLRGDQVFGSVDELISAMDRDRAKASEYWSSRNKAGV